jgi:hypothetical protein
MAKIWKKLPLGGSDSIAEPRSSTQKEINQFPSNLTIMSTDKGLKRAEIGNGNPNPIVSEGFTLHRAVIAEGNSIIDTNGIDVVKTNQAGSSNHKPLKAYRAKKRHKRRSSKFNRDPLKLASQKIEQVNLKESSKEMVVPKTPLLDRLPTPELSDLECGDFCACCDQEEGMELARS